MRVTESLIFQRLIYLICVFKIKIIVSKVALKIKFTIIIQKSLSKIESKTLKVRFAIVIKKSSSKTIIKVRLIAKYDFLNKNDMTLIKQCLLKLITKKLFIFTKIKNINNYSIYVFLCDLNKFNMILFMNINFGNVKIKI